MELLLTLEEYCSGEGVFEATGERGAVFGEVFVLVLQARPALPTWELHLVLLRGCVRCIALSMCVLRTHSSACTLHRTCVQSMCDELFE